MPRLHGKRGEIPICFGSLGLSDSPGGLFRAQQPPRLQKKCIGRVLVGSVELLPCSDHRVTTAVSLIVMALVATGMQLSR